MASIRRTLSPLSGRFYRTGSNPPIAASQKVSDKTTTFSPIRKFVGGLFLLTRKRSHLKRSLFACLMFFFLGILLGMAPFSNDYLSFELQNREAVEFLPDVGGGELGLVRGLKKTTAISSGTETKPWISDSPPDKLLIVVTPTYNRAFQAYYLNRLGQVLRLLRPPLLWIVVEMNAASIETSMILRNMGVAYRHLVCDNNKSAAIKDRGVHQRNTAIEHIETHKLDGIVYFADDDNVYTLELLQRMRDIRRFGTWPVGMMAQSKNKAVLEGPICSGNEVIGWHTNEKSKRVRRFHVDMSGFAFNSTILWDPKRWRRPTSAPIRQLDTVKEGFQQETSFIEQVVEDEAQMEGVPGGCDRIMNWHLHLESSHGMFDYPTGWMLQQHNVVDTSYYKLIQSQLSG
ncbi:hypothetical protein M569_07100 [Genlisea aurea]|uniref:Glycosyltransferases n=1 Tax=Genlisea aurea TaxID=192259 RepID=S8CS35_9LAMI|nr:hypothetical protein M569_07100 [Genlisea aurea]